MKTVFCEKSTNNSRDYGTNVVNMKNDYMGTVFCNEHKTNSEIVPNDDKANNERNYNCDRCSYSSDQKPILVNHIKAVHDKINSFSCNECSFKTGFKSSLNRHMRKAH